MNKDNQFKGGYIKPKPGEIIEFYDNSSLLKSVMIKAELKPKFTKEQYEEILKKRRGGD